MLQPFKHNVVWAFFDQKMAPSDSLVQWFPWKNRIFEVLFQYDNDIFRLDIFSGSDVDTEANGRRI